MLEWEDLAAAFALYLVLEGLIPFFSPASFKRFVLRVIATPDSRLRGFGFCSMVAGVILLYLVR